ncbi:MAG TPA: hypothetical protein VGQ30_05445, partial [Gemmatimonadaceae bacterium]|nr:hypothetical protein [Gemmatimonadaceae bacterium]
LFSQVVTLYVTPVVYTYFDEMKHRFSKGKKAPKLSDSVGGALHPGIATATTRAAHQPEH